VKPQDDGTEKPKVVARLALQGEENITSVSITYDGRLLAVSSASAVKLFQLLQPQVGSGANLRIRKLELPSIPGARTVRLTADGKWLSAISATNEILLVRIVSTEDPIDPPRALERTQHLHRLHRDSTPQTALGGPSGSYERSIVHAEFSSNGDIFATVDLAGYVDTWVIEGHEDPTAPEVDIDDASPAVADNDDSDAEEDEVDGTVTFLGQRWIRNPSAYLLPRLDSTPVLLSFQPILDSADRPQPNGNPAVHPTRHNPHPHSHDLPTAEHRLLLVSAEHQIYLFDVMAGRLSEWTRRNPPSSYPREYLQLDLPAKGCIWDINEAEQRLWLYGEKWLFMFNLDQDLSAFDSGAVGSKKRKRDARNNSGAGDRVSRKEASVTKIRRFDGKENIEAGKAKWVDINAMGQDESEDDADDIEDDTQPLASLQKVNTPDDDADSSKQEPGGQQMVHQRQQCWHTFKYRPILGILPMGGEDSQVPEVVLVERPSWDLDLPPRFVSTRE
jgi:U3 small nucleolar RNA-associated protein 4